MAINMFEQFGIKEVADVQFEDLTTGQVVLYLDTLKVSTLETTAEQTEAKGGKGNPPLIIWDFGKEISVTLEDALFSMTSLAIGQGASVSTLTTGSIPVRYTQEITLTTTTPTGVKTLSTGANKISYINLTTGLKGTVAAMTGLISTSLVGASGDKVKIFYDIDAVAANSVTVTIGPNTFPGTYKVIGDTFIRSKTDLKDYPYQFIIGQAKITSENTLTLEAEGDPTVFNMSLRVLRDTNGEMMKFIKYSLT